MANKYIDIGYVRIAADGRKSLVIGGEYDPTTKSRRSVTIGGEQTTFIDIIDLNTEEESAEKRAADKGYELSDNVRNAIRKKTENTPEDKRLRLQLTIKG